MLINACIKKEALSVKMYLHVDYHQSWQRCCLVLLCNFPVNKHCYSINSRIIFVQRKGGMIVKSYQSFESLSISYKLFNCSERRLQKVLKNLNQQRILNIAIM